MKKSLSNEAIRSLLQHIMFGVLFVLIILNWSVHRPMDYAIYEQMFERNKIENERYANQQLSWFSESDESGEKIEPYYDVAKKIKDSCEFVIREIEDVRTEIALGIIEKKEEIRLLENTLQKIDCLRRMMFTSLGFRDNSFFTLSVMNSEYEIHYCLGVVRGNFIGQTYTKNSLLVMLSALQNNVEQDRELMLNILYDKIHDNYDGFNGYAAWFVPDNYFVVEGSKLQGQMLLVKFLEHEKWSNKRTFALTVNNGLIDSERLDYSTNSFLWTGKAIKLGINTVNGMFSFKDRENDITRPFSFSYFVSAPGIAFHLDKANVCYVGVPNRVSINIPGYSAEKIKLRVAGAKVSKVGAGQFDIFISKMPAGKVYAYVDATNAQGRTSTVHSMELKLQHLPAPLTNFEAYKENGIALADFKAQKSLQIFPADTAFAIDYSVVSFEVECINARHQYREGIEVKGADFETNVELQKLIASAQPGERFIFSNIIAKATNGLSYEVLPVSVFIKDTP